MAALVSYRLDDIPCHDGTQNNHVAQGRLADLWWMDWLVGIKVYCEEAGATNQ